MNKDNNDQHLDEINGMLSDIETMEKDIHKIDAVEKVTRREGESEQDCVSRGIATLINEGYSQEQAAAIAYSMCGEKNCCPK